MKIFDYSNKTVLDETCFPESCRKSEDMFILCKTHEILLLHDIFQFDESTVQNCTDLDESIRYTSYAGYDFISMIHMEISETAFALREINLYVSPKYLILVMPEHNSPRLSAMETKMLGFAKAAVEQSVRLNKLYFSIFHHLLADFSVTLETLEDRMQELSEKIVTNISRDQFGRINTLRNISYAAKKQLRALSYLGEQILVDENKLIGKNQLHYFRSIDTRLKKLYDFAESLYNLGGEMLYTYDSRLTMKTNDTVNKLTVLTVFFGPLTVITGIYGMNFDFMPELKWSFGYPLALAAMAVVSLVVYFVLKKKKWL